PPSAKSAKASAAAPSAKAQARQRAASRMVLPGQAVLLAHDAPPLDAFGRPQLAEVVVLGDGRRTRGQDHPRLLAGGEDVHVGRESVGVVQSAHADEAGGLARACVMAPQRDAALRAARDLLALA